MDETNVIQLAVDYHNGVVKKYTKDEAKEVIRQALIAANGGTTKLSLRNFRNHPEMFTLIEQVISQTVPSGLSQNDFFNTYCETRNLAEGDALEFLIKADTNLVLADISRGNQAIRRQRIGESRTITLTPTPKAIHLYDELTRILSGRVDINDLINTISRAVEQTRLNEIYAAWSGITSSDVGGTTYYPVAGAYDEDTLFDLVDDVSIANDGAKCMLVTTLKGARKLSTGITSDSAKEDYYKNGYALNWNGVGVQIVPQRLQLNSTSLYSFDDDKIYVIPMGMDKPIKQVIGGEDMFEIGQATDNEDMTIDIKYIITTNTALVTGKKFGIYETT